MDTKEIKKYLKRYAGLKTTVERQLEQIARAKNETEIPAFRPSDGSQRQPGSSGDRFESAAIRYMDTKERLLPSIEANVEQMKQIEANVNSLEDYFESLVLTLKYIYVDGYNSPTWKEIAKAIYKSDDEKDEKAVTRLHGRALVSLGAIIEAKETSRP